MGNIEKFSKSFPGQDGKVAGCNSQRTEFGEGRASKTANRWIPGRRRPMVLQPNEAIPAHYP